MRLFTVIRNDREPQSVKAEKFKTDSKDYIFSKYDPASTYDIVVATIPVDKVVEISSEEVEAPKRTYKVTLKDGSEPYEVKAECTSVANGEVIFMNYDGDYTEFTTVTKVPTANLSRLDVID